jgi:hypothetical protein
MNLICPNFYIIGLAGTTQAGLLSESRSLACLAKTRQEELGDRFKRIKQSVQWVVTHWTDVVQHGIKQPLQSHVKQTP